MPRQPEQIGPYRIESELGQGGMATVYRAMDTRNNRVVALKALPSGYMAQGDRIPRFRRESALVMRLRHPNIVHVYDTGEADDYFYIAMEIASGGTLEKRITSSRGVSNREISLIISQVAIGLDYAHSQGLVHRDIKPSNIMFTEDGRVILTDFGVAKDLGDHKSNITTIGTTIGTPAYMSPEQARADRAIDQRSDIYSLGVVTYHLLAGRVPFVAGSYSEMITMIGTQPAPSVQSINPRIPTEIAQVVHQALAPNPRDRFPSAGAFAQALYTALNQSNEVGTQATFSSTHTSSATHKGYTASVGRASDRWRRRAGLGLLYTGGALAVVALFVAMAVQLKLLPGGWAVGFPFVSPAGSINQIPPPTAIADNGSDSGAGETAALLTGPTGSPTVPVAFTANATPIPIALVVDTATSTWTPTAAPTDLPTETPTTAATATRTATRTATHTRTPTRMSTSTPMATLAATSTRKSTFTPTPKPESSGPTNTPTPLLIGSAIQPSTATSASTKVPTATPLVVNTRTPVHTPTGSASAPLPRTATPAGGSRNLTITKTPVPVVNITAPKLNVRNGPGTDYAVVGSVLADQQYEVTGQKGSCEWLKIRYNNLADAWVSGSAQYVSMAVSCSLIPTASAPPTPTPGAATATPRPANTPAPSSGSNQGCILFVNELNAELNITFTRQGDGWNTTFKVATHGEAEKCFDPGSYTYTIDAPPPWGSSNGKLDLPAGVRWRLPIGSG